MAESEVRQQRYRIHKKGHMTEQDFILQRGAISSASSISRDILGNRARGWCTAYKGADTGFELSLLKWKPGIPANFVPLTWSYRLFVQECFQGLVGAKYIAGGAGGNFEFIKIGEFDPLTGTLLAETQFGDSSSRWGAVTPVHTGGLAGMIYCDAGEERVIRFDAIYRFPDPPPIPGGGTSPRWQIQRFNLPSTGQGSVAQRYSMFAVQGQDRLVYVFYTRDSTATIGLARFSITGSGMSLVDHNESFIPRGIPETPSGEFPNVTAAVDPYHGGIVLAYQGWDDLITTCEGLKFAAHWILTRVQYDKSYRRIGIRETSWTSHNIHPRPAIYPRPEGIYWLLDYQNVNTATIVGDCKSHWEAGIFKDGQFAPLTPLDFYSIVALSKDGTIIAYNLEAQMDELIEINFPPVLTARRWGDSIRLDWDKASPTDIVEKSSDLRNWSPAGYSGLPPATFPMDQPKQFFRVKVQ